MARIIDICRFSDVSVIDGLVMQKVKPKNMDEDNEYVYKRLSTKGVTDESLSDLAQGEEISGGNEAAVSDKYCFVQYVFFLVGLVSALPYNVFITPTDYWMYKFRDLNSSESVGIHTNKTRLQTYFFGYMTLASNLPILFMVFVNVLWGHKSTLITVSHLLITRKCNDVLFNSSGAVHGHNYYNYNHNESSIAGTASRFPPSYMHSMITGQACSGLFPTIIQILSLLGHIHPLRSALYYFVITDITLIFVFISFLLSQKTEFYKYYDSREEPTDEIADKSTPIMMYIWPHAICVLLVCWATLSIFPIGVLALPRHPNSSPWTGRFFIPLCYFLVYNFSDFCGRITGGSISISHRYALLALSIFRWIIVVFVLLCNIHPRSHLPVVFENEAYFVFFSLLLGFTNGYVLINAMVSAPKQVPLEYRERAGFIMVMFNAVGVNLGAFMCSLFLRVI
ncbi:Equilibrative nucleoside transporter 3-like protein [Leptotrombidium deliense]|uniref:Equilibrative nucleoside transporter 3-like protein n=1 Tax=Leptotrombidium deliense TaxID=299467 RepID=A0A443S585_9ACAR|nr:Equilibrative nucleoside transporter 3-like protein [Leptotrombidium deliense]